MKCQISQTIRIVRDEKGRNRIKAGKPGPEPAVKTGRLPRIVRLMALALRYERMVREGKPASYAEIARYGHLSRSRLTQIMNLTLLAPAIMTELLAMPRVLRGRDPITEKGLRPIAAEPLWEEQLKRWHTLKLKCMD